MVLYLKNVFHLIVKFFWRKIRKILKLEEAITKFDEERAFFEKKNAFIFLKGMFNKIVGRKTCQW